MTWYHSAGVTSCLSLPRTFLGLALEVLCPRKHLHPAQIWTVQHQSESGLASWAPYAVPHCPGLRGGPFLVQCFAVTVLKFLIMLGKALHFHFLLDPANYVAGPIQT